MPARSGSIIYVPGKGTYDTKKKTFAGKGAAPPGVKKIPEATAQTAATVTVSPSGRTTTSGYRPSAAKRQVRAADKARKRVTRIVRSVSQSAARRQRSSTSAPPVYTTPPQKKSRAVGYTDNPAKATISMTPNPAAKPERFRGKPTAGSPTRAALERAAAAGTLKLNRQGFTTTPKVRRAGRNLKLAKRAVRKSQPSLAGLSPAEAETVKYARKAHRKYPDIPTSLLMALTRQESGFNAAAVSSADAQGLTQFIPSTAAGYGVKYGTGRKEKQSQETGAARLLHDNNFASDPQGALSSYSGGYAAADYNNPILSGASDYTGLDKPGSPKALKRLKRARIQARKVGLKAGAQPQVPGEKVGGPGRIPSVVYIGKQAEKRFGLAVGENPAFGGVDPVHVSDSYHYRTDAKGRGEAIDVSGDPAKMLAFDQWVARRWGQGVTELFYDPGTSIKEGTEIGAIGGHGDHVHVAVAMPGERIGGGVSVAGPSGAVFVGYGPTAAAATASAGRAAKAAGKGKGRRVSPFKRYWKTVAKLERLGVGQTTRPESQPAAGITLDDLERKYGKAAA